MLRDPLFHEKNTQRNVAMVIAVLISPKHYFELIVCAITSFLLLDTESTNAKLYIGKATENSDTWLFVYGQNKYTYI